MEYDSSVLIYSPLIEEAYVRYRTLKPLDLATAAEDDDALSYWREHLRYDISEFSRQLSCLTQAKTLDDYVFASGGDFDSLAAVVSTALATGIISISDTGAISTRQEVIRSQSSVSDAKQTFVPNSDYNQFPCDEASVARRVEHLANRYPNLERIAFGLIGDDDFVSLSLSELPQFDVTVVEKDPRIINTIESRAEATNSKLRIEEFDIINVESRSSDTKLQSFMTDPPYTVDGALAFIYCGLSMMTPRQDNGAEFYVVLNPTMMGRNLLTVLEQLSLADIHVTGIERNFSQYRLPGEFEERRRANGFLSQYGITSDDALTYSSSSNLYTFTIGQNYTPSSIKEFITPERMYEHYG